MIFWLAVLCSQLLLLLEMLPFWYEAERFLMQRCFSADALHPWRDPFPHERKGPARLPFWEGRGWGNRIGFSKFYCRTYCLTAPSPSSGSGFQNCFDLCGGKKTSWEAPKWFIFGPFAPEIFLVFFLQRHFRLDGRHVGGIGISCVSRRNKFMTYQTCFGAPFSPATHPPPPAFLDPQANRWCVGYVLQLWQKGKDCQHLFKAWLEDYTILQFQMDSRYSRYNPIIPGVFLVNPIAPMDNPNNLKTTHKLQLQLCGQNLKTWQQNNPSWASHHNSCFVLFKLPVGGELIIFTIAQQRFPQPALWLSEHPSSGRVGGTVKRHPWKCEKKDDSH